MEQVTKESQENSDKAGSSHTGTESKQEKDKTVTVSTNDVELDITSEHFNPLKALYAPGYRVTEKEPKIIYQNMAAFETALKKVGISGLNNVAKACESKVGENKNTLLVKQEKEQRRFQDHQMAIRTQSVKTKHQRNIITQMSQFQGPLQKLQQFVSEGRCVKILIRREHGIKGYVEGVLKMFDRHWNLLLADAMECLVYRKYKYAEDKLVTHQSPQDCSSILQQLGVTLPKQSVKSLGRKRVEIRRHLPQILLRGEHVVLISAIASV